MDLIQRSLLLARADLGEVDEPEHRFGVIEEQRIDQSSLNMGFDIVFDLGQPELPPTRRVDIILEVKVPNNAPKTENQNIPVGRSMEIMPQTEGTEVISWAGELIYKRVRTARFAVLFAKTTLAVYLVGQLSVGRGRYRFEFHLAN